MKTGAGKSREPPGMGFFPPCRSGIQGMEVVLPFFLENPPGKALQGELLRFSLLFHLPRARFPSESVGKPRFPRESAGTQQPKPERVEATLEIPTEIPFIGKKPQIPPKPLQRPRGALPSQSREECRNSRHYFPVFPKKLREPRRKFPIFYSFPGEMLGAENNPIFLQFSQRNFRI